MNLLETSKRLSEEDKILEKLIGSLELYIFSSQVRPVIFGYKFGKVREEKFSDLMQRLNNLDAMADKLLAGIEGYYNELERSNCFFQEKYFILAKRFVYNAIKKNRLMKGSIKRIIKYLEIIKIAKEPKETQAISRLIRNEFKLSLEYAKEINVLVSDIQGRIQIEEYLVNDYKDLKRYLINKNEIETGDILFSFKTKGYFKKKMISRIINKVTSSQVTHVLLAAKVSPSDVRMIDSHVDAESSGVHLRDFKIHPGEIFIVLRPRISPLQIKLLLKKTIEHLRIKPGFSDLKLAGVFVSFLMSKFINKFTSGYALVPNFIRTRKAKFFCSKFINQAFKESGILLTPKSKFSSIVFPADLIVSPFLDYVGLVFDDSGKSEGMMSTYLNNVKI